MCEAVTAYVVSAACFGRGSAPAPDVQQCIAHLCVVAGTGGIRCLRQLAIAHWAQTLPITATEGGRVLRPMIPAPAQEPRPFCVLCDSCHAALSDQPGSAQIRLGTPGRWLLPPPKPVRLTADVARCCSVVKLCVCALPWLPVDFPLIFWVAAGLWWINRWRTNRQNALCALRSSSLKVNDGLV